MRSRGALFLVAWSCALGCGGRVVADSAQAPSACAGELVSCDGRCVDTSSDSANCGACAHDCLGGGCASGACQPVIVLTSNDVGSVQAVAADEANVYLATLPSTPPGRVDGSIVQLPTTGGPPVVLAPPGSSPVGIAVAAGRVYWTNFAETGGSVMAVPIDGGAPITIATGLDGPWGIAVDETSVYWTSYGPLGSTNGTIMKAPLGGGPPATIVANQDNPTSILVRDGVVYFVTGVQEVAVMMVPTAGGTPTMLADGLALGGIAVDSGSLYAARATDPSVGLRTIERVPLAGGAPIAMVDEYTSDNPHLAVDATSVYWLNDYTLAKAPIDGSPRAVGKPGPIGANAGASQPSILTGNAAAMYWIDPGSKNVLKLAR